MFLGFPCGSAGKEPAWNAGDLDSIPGFRRSPREGKGYPLQYSGLENSTDCIGHGVAKSRTRLSDFLSLHFHNVLCVQGMFFSAKKLTSVPLHSGKARHSLASAASATVPSVPQGPIQDTTLHLGSASLNSSGPDSFSVSPSLS